MEDLNAEELKQLVMFYKQKASDTEFTMLQAQIKLNRFLSNQVSSDQIASDKSVSVKK